MSVRIEDFDHEKFIFPGGEVSVKINTLPKSISHTVPREPTIHAHLSSSEDIMELLLVCDAMRHKGYRHLKLDIPYIPYARQDRVCNDGEAYGIQVMAQLINSIGAESVTIYDPHSDVTPALINNVNIVEQHIIVKKHPEILNTIIRKPHVKTGDYDGEMEAKTLVCPDAGAEKKIQKLKMPYIMATKVRDPVTGEIKRTHVYAESTQVEDQDMLIIDDIADGGRTFIELAKVLNNMGAKSVTLYVTHGIFSKGFKPFCGHIDKIYWYQDGELQCKDLSSSNTASTE